MKTLREVLLLPFALCRDFPLGSYRFRHFEPVVGRSWCVGGYVDGCYRLAGCSCGGSRCGTLGCPSCRVRVERSFADDGHFHRLALAYPPARFFDGFARPVIIRALFFKIRKHMLGAEHRPEHPRSVLLPFGLRFHKGSIFLSESPVNFSFICTDLQTRIFFG